MTLKPTEGKSLTGLTRDTFLLAMASFFSDISTEMLYPVLPVFLTQVLGATGSAVGLVDGLAQAAQNIAQGFSGWLSDKLQRRKPIALTGYLLSAVAKPLIGLAATWPPVLGARFIDRLGAGTRSAPRDALLAATVESRFRGRAFGLEGFGDNLGAFVGPLLAIALLGIRGFNLRWLFYIALIPGLTAFLLVLLVRERAAATTQETKIDLRLRHYPAAYWQYVFVVALFNIGNSSNAFLILHTRDLGVSLTATIFIYAMFNLVAALVSYPAGAISDRLGRRNLLLLAFLVFVVTYLVFALTHSIAIIAAMFILYGLFQGIFRAVGKTMATDLVPRQLRASGIGWYSAAVGFSQLAASIIAGTLWDRASHQAVFYFGASFAVLGSVALLAFVRNRPAHTLAAE